MVYSFSSPKIVFGPGCRLQVGQHAASLGHRCLLVTGSDPGRHEWLRQSLGMVMDELHVVTISTEPEALQVESLAATARTRQCNLVVAIGGGSVLDSGKALAALIANSGAGFEYLEVVGQARPLERDSVPMIALPTTSGTGAEVTANAVLLSKEHGVKVSLRSPSMMPTLAVVDPELTISLPPAQTAATGMDAVTQLVEAFVSHAASPLTDPLCRDGLVRSARSLRRAFRDGRDLDARIDMSLAGMFSGMALANAKLGAVHGFAAPLGAELNASHGAICARLLPFVMDANIAALRKSAPGHPVQERYAEVARLLTASPAATIEDGVRYVHELCEDLAISSLSAMGLKPDMVDELARKASLSSSMRGNPVVLEHQTLVRILERAC